MNNNLIISDAMTDFGVDDDSSSKFDNSNVLRLLRKTEVKRTSYLNLDKQIIELSRLNSLMPNDLRQPDKWFLDFNSQSNREQSPEHFTIPFVVTQNIEDVFRYQVELLKLAYPKMTISPANQLLKVPNMDIFKSNGIYRCELDLTHNPLADHVFKNHDKQIFMNSGVIGMTAYALQGKKLLQDMDGAKLPFLYVIDLSENESFGYIFRQTASGPRLTFEKKSDLNPGQYCVPVLIDKWQ